jgi:membrane protein DedA with SNARE-associated domain
MLALASLIAATASLGYGLPAIIGLESFGVPSPGETALITAAVLASEGRLQIWLVLVIAIASAVLGDSIGYELGRHLGREVLTARGPLRSERVRAVHTGERFFAKHGNKTVFFARWITGVRSAAAWLAGIDEMPYPTFLLYNAAGAITWALSYGLVGYFGGPAAADAIKTAGTYALIAVGVIVVVLLVWWVRRRRRRAGESRPASVAGDPDAVADPGSTPTDPGQTPTDPGQTPTDPGQTPTDPGPTPTDPGQTPTDPGQTPTDPGQTPTDPGQTPTDPGQTPTDPGQAPIEGDHGR